MIYLIVWKPNSKVNYIHNRKSKSIQLIKIMKKENKTKSLVTVVQIKKYKGII
jgi:hypothetical protein